MVTSLSACTARAMISSSRSSMSSAGGPPSIDRHGALARERDGHRVRAHTTASCAEGGVGGWGVHETGSTPRKAALARWGIEIDR